MIACRTWRGRMILTAIFSVKPHAHARCCGAQCRISRETPAKDVDAIQ